jgi:hypothetical protein
MEESGGLHALTALILRKQPWYPLERRLGGTLNWFGHSGSKEGKSHVLQEIEPLSSSL